MRTLYHPKTEEIELPTVLYALSDPIRLELLLHVLKCKEMSCGEYATDIPKSTMSHHFKVLRESGVMNTRLAGTQRFMSVRKEELDSRFPGLLDAIVQASESR